VLLCVGWPLLAGLLAGRPGDARAIPTAPAHVRAETPELRQLIAETAAGSPTVRELIARLGFTDAIVYVEITSSPLVPTARTKLVATVATARFIRIGLSASTGHATRGALLAHELQHALEIAEHDDVRDETAVRRLYEQIGRARGGDRFETEAAQAVEWNVRLELHSKIGG
jgi:hypothetical protein